MTKSAGSYRGLRKNECPGRSLDGNWGIWRTGRPCTVFAPRRLTQRTCPDKKRESHRGMLPGASVLRAEPTRQEDNNAAVGILGDTSCYATVASRHNGEGGEHSGRKKNDGFAQMWRGLPPCLFFAPQKAQAVDCARAGRWRKKSDPPRKCPQGAGSFVRGGNLLSHTRVQYHRRGRA